MHVFLGGFGLGLSLIIAIGAQNLFVLRQGIRREHVLVVVAICALSDAVLIGVGISGLGTVLGAVPWLVEVIRWLGAAFLITYGLLAGRRALWPSGIALSVEGAGTSIERGGADAQLDAQPAAQPAARGGLAVATTSIRTRGRMAVIGTCLALTWLNPHVYLDTVFLLGSVANTHGDGRWVFGVGAMLGSVVWFAAIGFGARLLSGVLASPRAWRVLDGVIAVVMIGLGVLLVVPSA